MPVVSDFTHLNKTSGAGITIGDSQTSWETEFDTGGRTTGMALLMIQVSGLTYATQGARVKVNGDLVGHIQPFRYRLEADRLENDDHWFTQYVVFGGSLLNDGTPNVFRVEAVGFPEAEVGVNEKDDFRIREVGCWFHQEV